MTRFIDVPTMAKFMKDEGVANLIETLVNYIRKDFQRWEEFDKTPRVANHSSVGVIELMPVSNDKLYSFKYVNGHPQNYKKNLSTVMAFGVLSEVETGYPLLLSELTLSTAIRTAATSVLAAQYLTRKNSHTMALIGNGSQSEFQALGFYKVLGIKNIRCFDIDPDATTKFIENLKDIKDLNITRHSSTKEACKGADIITTITADKTLATIITPDMVEKGVFINAVGGDCPGKTELHEDVVKNASVFVEFEPQSRIEGEIQHMSEDFKTTQLYTLIKENKLGRKNDHEVTIFDSVGFALEDYSTLRMLYDLATQKNIGEFIKIVPDMENPKDLFGLTKDRKTSVRLKGVA